MGPTPETPYLPSLSISPSTIERMGTGTRDMIRRCKAAGLAEPEFKLTDGFVTTIRRPDRAEGPSRVGAEEERVTDPVTAPVTAPVTSE